jgi:hypothetical protein
VASSSAPGSGSPAVCEYPKTGTQTKPVTTNSGSSWGSSSWARPGSTRSPIAWAGEARGSRSSSPRSPPASRGRGGRRRRGRRRLPAGRACRGAPALDRARARPARDLVGARFETAVPPKPAHIALALSSGLFNGHRLEPNDPRRDPPILAKGTFQRRWIEVDEKTDADGEVTAVVEIEQPQLELSVLHLDDYTFHTLAPGTVPTGAPELARWNAADLTTRYDRALVRLLGQQFPAIHDPTRSDHRIVLPGLARRPFRAQAEAAQAALKVLARGRNPFLVAEVGTGKTTMALTIAAALSPAFGTRRSPSSAGSGSRPSSPPSASP